MRPVHLHRWPAILIATTNPGKIREIRAILAGLPASFLTLGDVLPMSEPEEYGETFAENARIKSAVYGSATGLPTVAEDSGLAIDALGGRPGVQSARYPGTTYMEKFAGLYRELAAHAQPWPAHFVSALAFSVPDPDSKMRNLFSCEGVVNGEIAPEPRGIHGFGYDPLFYYPPYGKTLGEASDEEKLAVSHRGNAFRQFRAWLEAE